MFNSLRRITERKNCVFRWSNCFSFIMEKKWQAEVCNINFKSYLYHHLINFYLYLFFFILSAKTHIHFTLHVLADLMAAVTEDQVTKTKLILYQSIADVVQLTLTIFPLFIHHPGTMKVNESNRKLLVSFGAVFN